MLVVAPFLLALAMQIDITKFGTQPNTRKDASEAVRKAISALRPGETLSFPTGEFHFYEEGTVRLSLHLSNTTEVPFRKVSIPLQGLRDIRIVGKGTRLVFHGHILPITIRNCQNLTLQGFEIDWERPVMSQGEVLGSSPTSVVVQMEKDSPYRIENNKVVFVGEGWAESAWAMMRWDPKTKGVVARTGDDGIGSGWGNAKATEIRRGVVQYDSKFSRPPAVGERLLYRNGQRIHGGTFIENSTRITLRDMDYRHATGLGVLAQYSDTLTYERVSFEPAKGSRRLFSGHDDGFQFSNCKGKIVVSECHFQGLMDDPINVHGTSVRVMKRIDDHRLLCRFEHDQAVGLKFGDPSDQVNILHHESLLPIFTGSIRSIHPTSLSEFEVEFREVVPSDLHKEAALENMTWTPEFAVRKCVFGGVRARGLLVTTPRKVVIEDNLFQSSGSAILISGDTHYWFESGAVHDVMIRRNRFENCLTSNYQFCDGVISIQPVLPKPGKPFHSNIRILENEFVVFDRPLLYALSVDKLTFTGNRIRASKTYQPWNLARSGLSFLECTNVVVRRNEIDSDAKCAGVFIKGGNGFDLDWPGEKIKE